MAVTHFVIDGKIQPQARSINLCNKCVGGDARHCEAITPQSSSMLCDQCGTRDGDDFGQRKVKAYAVDPRDAEHARMSRYPSQTPVKKNLASGEVENQKFSIDLCRNCHTNDDSVPLAMTRPIYPVCMACGMVEDRYQYPPEIWCYVYDPRKEERQDGSQASLRDKFMEAAKWKFDQEFGVAKGETVLKVAALVPLPPGVTRHPPLPLACLTLPDAACFMKGK